MTILNLIDNINYFDNKVILITGGTGTLGNALTDFFLNKTNVNKIIIFSRDEYKQHIMKNKFKTYFSKHKIQFFIGDIRDNDRTKFAMKGVDIVFHAAALKQVDSIEFNPMEAIKTNILGTESIIEACIHNNVKQLVGISTDKSVCPVNLYGATKICLEKLIIAGYEYSNTNLKTCVLRYGNVIGSRGSVVPIFKKQSQDGIFTVTDKRMTRFTLTINEACNFILNCSIISNGGEIFVPKLPTYTINQLCNVINSNCKINEIGIRPGEKLHEFMISEAESLLAWESKDFYIIESNISPIYKLNPTLIEKFKLIKSDKIFSYSSENAMNISDEGLLQQINL